MNLKVILTGCFNLKQPFLLSLVLLSAFALLTLSCSDPDVPDEERIIFTVNDFELNVFDFEQGYVEYLINTGQNDTRTERYIFLNQWIDEIILAQEASKRDYLSNEAYQQSVALEKRKKMADVYFVDEINKILEPPTDDELRIAFGKKKRKVFVRHLFSRNPQDLLIPYDLLTKGESFVDVANTFYETEEYDSLAGYLGPVGYFSADDSFAETAFSLNQGEFSEPIRSRYGYHIIYIDFIEFPAILTEDDYQLHIDGTTSQLNLRRQALESNDYIYNLMTSMDVEVDAPKILELKDAIAAISEEGEEFKSIKESTDIETWDRSKVDRLGIEFDENEVLATYMLDGEAFTFTFADYLRWLKYLPFNESKTNTGASVGRAMRNQVLYQLAEKGGYQENEFVNKEIKKYGLNILSQLYMYDIAASAIRDTTDWDVPNEFSRRLLKNIDYILDTDFWMIRVADRDRALEVKEELSAGKDPRSFQGFESFMGERVNEVEANYNLIRDALISRPLVAFSDTDGWIVLNVLRRDVVETEDQALKKVDVQKRFKAFKSVNNVVDSLRMNAEISIDTLLFNEIYDVNRELRVDK